MKCVDREGNIVAQNDTQNSFLEKMYKTVPGRMALKVMVQPWVTNIGGKLLDSSLSLAMVPGFVKRNNIDLDEYEDEEYRSYNDFFTRKIRPEKRAVNGQPEVLIAPCDSKLTVYPIEENASFDIKGTKYTLASLVRSRRLAEHYKGGQILIFRLTVDDYHHYCYIDDGRKTKNYHIDGVYHTVNPVANEVYPIYKENTREFSILKGKNFGNILMMEVGALMVGRIVNLQGEAEVYRGQEKGYFEFGGSTVVICLEKDRAIVDEDILSNSKAGVETVVKFGEAIGTAFVTK